MEILIPETPTVSVADSHNFDADPDADPDPACHFDPDPDADPDPACYIDVDPDAAGSYLSLWYRFGSRSES